jgi:hypothetical protein
MKHCDETIAMIRFNLMGRLMHNHVLEQTEPPREN